MLFNEPGSAGKQPFQTCKTPFDFVLVGRPGAIPEQQCKRITRNSQYEMQPRNQNETGDCSRVMFSPILQIGALALNVKPHRRVD